MTDRLCNVIRSIEAPFVIDKNTNLENINLSVVEIIVLSGSNSRINEVEFRKEPGFIIIDHVINYLLKHSRKDIKVLGVCYGMHILTKYFNGTVHAGSANIKHVSDEYGGELFLGKKYLNYHDFVRCAPPPFQAIFVTKPAGTFHVLEMRWNILGWIGVQYHPEGTEEGLDWLREFLKSSLRQIT